MRNGHRKAPPGPFRPADNSLFRRHLTRLFLLCFFGIFDWMDVRLSLCTVQTENEHL